MTRRKSHLEILVETPGLALNVAYAIVMLVTRGERSYVKLPNPSPAPLEQGVLFLYGSASKVFMQMT
jgi:hypothetical protein